MPLPIAFVRSIPAAFADALSSSPEVPAIDVGVARAQHSQYITALARGGFQVEGLDTPADLADGPFIEDTGVLVAGTLILTRPGAPSRRAEVAGVGEALEDRFEIRTISTPGTLEGGDVLRLGARFYVGRSSRTNDDGIQQLAAIAAEHGIETVPVPVQNTLHLKSVVTALDDNTLIAAPGHFDLETFGGAQVHWVEGESEVNVLGLPDGSILIPASKSVLQGVVAAAGYEVKTIDVSEFEKADGGLTCLSLRTNGT